MGGGRFCLHARLACCAGRRRRFGSCPVLGIGGPVLGRLRGCGGLSRACACV
nr:MAG TPA: hypothetical protein [Caudoviricetes sp.]